MNKPAGLARFSRVIPTKRSGACFYCDAAMAIGRDFAAVDASGAWQAICATCATSITEQVKGLVRSIQARTEGRTIDANAILMPTTENLSATLAGTATEALAFDTLLALVVARSMVEDQVKVVDPRIAAVRALATNATLGAWERTFTQSVLEQHDRGRDLSVKQWAIIDRIIAEQSTPTEAPAGPLAPGLYVVGPDGDWSSFWLVRTGRQSGNLYAMRLMSAPREGGKLDWEFVRGGLRDVRRGRPATAAEAAALGHATHHCCFCGIELTDEGNGRSVEVGYGPICANKNGLPWG